MATNVLPSQSDLHQLLRYDAETGKLFWRERQPKWFAPSRYAPEHVANIWNNRFSGKEAFVGKVRGYRQAPICGVRALAHRVIWKMVYGSDPTEVDHINGVRDDNRLCNLREVDRATNLKNTKLHSLNTSGVHGVSRFRGKWHARITVDYRCIHLGYFDSFDDAVAARKAAEVTHEFHENHGR